MQPVASGPVLLPMLIPPPPSHPPPPIPDHPSIELATAVKDCPSDPCMTWKRRGEYHLGRREFDPAIEAFTKALQDSEKKGNDVLIGENLKNLGRVFLEKERWALAAKIFNGAYAILPKNGQLCPVTLALMAEVERRFLEKVGGVRKPIDPKVYLERRQKLLALRHEAKVKIQQETPSQIMLDFTQGISHFLNEMLKSGFALFGKPPCEYAVIGLGSLARKEMSPYSDLEFALLVEDSSPAKVDYFRKMIQWLELQVINLGETPIKILRGGFESPIVRGFSFDDGGNTPLGKQGQVELIKTPEVLAQFQLERFYEEDLILSNVLRTADIVVGNQFLYARYLKAIQPILNAKSAKSPLTTAQERALNLLQGHLVEFEPHIDKRKEETPIYNIKAELYRLPSFLIEGLAEYFGVAEQNTWKRLDALVKANIFSEEGAKHLRDAMDAIMRLRIRCHLHYGKECEDVYHPSMQLKEGTKLPPNVFVLTDVDIRQIMEIYRVIFPLHRLFKQVCQTRDFALLSKETFYDPSPLTQGKANEKLYQYAEAKKSYQQAVAINPDDGEGLIDLADLFRRLAEHIQAKEYASKAYALGKRKGEERLVARALNLQGVIYRQLGELKQAISFYEEAVKVGKQVYGDAHPEVSSYLNNLGLAWQALGDPKKAIVYFDDAHRINRRFYGVVHPLIANDLNNLGGYWKTLGDAKKAVGYYEEALRICKQVYGDEHPDMAAYLNNLGSAWKALGDVQKAIGYYEKALQISKKIYGDEHPNVAMCLSNLGSAWQAIGNAKKAIEYHEMALRINKNAYDNDHPHIASCLNNLGIAWKALGDVKKAITYFEEALRIRQKIYRDAHSSVATCLNNLGTAWQALGEVKKAIAYFEEALTIDQKIYKTAHPEVAKHLSNLGTAWHDLGNGKKAIDYYVAALHIGKKVYSHMHPELAIYLHNLGCAWNDPGISGQVIY